MEGPISNEQSSQKRSIWRPGEVSLIFQSQCMVLSNGWVKHVSNVSVANCMTCIWMKGQLGSERLQQVDQHHNTQDVVIRQHGLTTIKSKLLCLYIWTFDWDQKDSKSGGKQMQYLRRRALLWFRNLSADSGEQEKLLCIFYFTPFCLSRLY